MGRHRKCNKDGKKIVRVLDESGQLKEVVVVTGLRGSDGNIEIVEGISEGDKVIIFDFTDGDENS